MSHTFQVSDKPISERYRFTKKTLWHEASGIYERLEGSTLYASDVQTVGGPSPFFHAVSYAFNSHCPLVLTPDAVWLTILSGLTHHIDTDPEGLRHHFVAHEGQKTLKVSVLSPSIKQASREIWEAGIRGFSSLLLENLNPKKHELLISNFSTTTETDRLSSQVALMGAMKHYFEYKMMLLCGLTRVTVLGTPEDWQSIIDRTQALSEFGLTWWTNHLIPVLQQFKAANEGRPDVAFWELAYLSHRKGSGSQYDVSGWVNAFYPYVAGKKPNEMARNTFVSWESNGTRGLDPDDFPLGLVSAPVEVNDHGTVYPCKFYGGLVGVSLADDHTVRPESGIAIQHLDGTVRERHRTSGGIQTEMIVLSADKV